MEGKQKGSCLEGYDEREYENGRKYRGHWKEGFYTKGEHVWPSGDKYEGEYGSKNRRHGKGGFTWTDGRKYDGMWVEDKMCGKGIFQFPNGDSFFGDLEKEKW